MAEERARRSRATNSIYTFPALAAGNYSVLVTNLFGSILSSNAVLSLNFIPIATPQSISLNEDTPTAMTLGGSDDNKDALTFAIVRPPAHGSLSGAPPVVIYSPGINYNGPDSFSFKVNDGFVDSSPAEVSLTVLPVNDPPIALAQTVSVDEDTPVSITLAGTDVENSALSFVVTLQPSHGSLSGQPPNLTYFPATNYNGIDSFLFKANDSELDSAPASVTIHIRPVNDPPVAIAHVSPLFQFIIDQTNQWILSLNNSNATVVLDGSSSSDVDNDPLTYSWTEGTNGLGGGILASNLFDVGPSPGYPDSERRLSSKHRASGFRCDHALAVHRPDERTDREFDDAGQEPAAPAGQSQGGGHFCRKREPRLGNQPAEGF